MIKVLTDSKLKELYGGRFTYVEISLMYDISISCISKRITKMINDKEIVKRANVRKKIFTEPEIRYIDELIRPKIKIDKQPKFKTEELIQEEKIVEMYNEGNKCYKIALELKCSKSLVSRVIREYKDRESIKRRKIKAVDRNYIIELYKNNMSTTQITIMAECSNNSITRIISSEINNGNLEERNRLCGVKKDNKIIKMYKEYKPIQEIAKENNRSIKAIQRYIDGLIQDNVIEERNTIIRCKNYNRLKNEEKLVIKYYSNGISNRVIADYYRLSTKQVSLFVTKYRNRYGICRSSINKALIIDMIIKEKLKVKEISNRLDIPESLLYKHIKDVL